MICVLKSETIYLVDCNYYLYFISDDFVMEVDPSPEGAIHISSFMNALNFGTPAHLEIAEPCKPSVV